VEVGPDEVAILPYSSGTTGLPKGVVLTHRGLMASLCQTLAVTEVGEGDVVVAVLPLFHSYGMQVSMNLALHAGATVVLMPRFDSESGSPPKLLISRFLASRSDRALGGESGRS
jgi:acyl-CoA synthetase (AMP-forming)/AMP-acid ligase II